MLAHMKTRHIDANVEIVVSIPARDAARVSGAIRGMLELAGHQVRELNGDGEELKEIEEIFPEAGPSMALRGFRGKLEMTQEELADKLGISQNRVSDMESGKRRISINMSKRLAEIFSVSHRVFL